MKKIAIVAMSAMCVLALAGCNKKAGNSAAALEAAANGDYSKLKVQKDPKTKKAYDFGGLSVTVYDWWSNASAPAATKDEEDQRAFRAYLEETYNFKCVQDNLNAGWGGHPAEVANYCITGGDDARIFVIDGRSAYAGLAANLWADISKCPDIDWTKEKWNKAVLNAMPGKSFAVGMPEARHVIFFNKRVLQENGFDPDLPYDLQKEGKWTWAKFEEICAALTKDTDNDGIIDQYALSGFNSEFWTPALISNGARLITTDANGKYVLDFSDNAMEGWEFMRRVFVNYNKPAGEGANWDYFKADFLSGATAFYNDEQYDAQPNGMLQDMKDDWGMVCFPTGPKGDGKYFTLNKDNMFVIPSYYDQDKVNKIMKIYDLWSDTVPGYEDKDSWKDRYYACYRDTRSVDETMQIMMDNSIAWSEWLLPGFNWDSLSWSICAGADPQETLESNKNQMQAALDEMNK